VEWQVVQSSIEVAEGCRPFLQYKGREGGARVLGLLLTAPLEGCDYVFGVGCILTSNSASKFFAR
jgi:hypothetical protein